MLLLRSEYACMFTVRSTTSVRLTLLLLVPRPGEVLQVLNDLGGAAGLLTRAWLAACGSFAGLRFLQQFGDAEVR